MPTNVRFQVCQVSAAAQGSFAQKVLLRLGKPESVLWHHLRYLWRARLPVYATPVVVGGRLRGDAWCGMQLSTPQFRGVLHKPRIGIVPDPFLVKAVWLRETTGHPPPRPCLIRKPNARKCAELRTYFGERSCVRAFGALVCFL